MTTLYRSRAIWNLLKLLAVLCVVLAVAILVHAPAAISTPLHFGAIACGLGTVLVFVDESRKT